MKALFMLIGTLLLMAVFAAASYVFSHKQLISMQKKIDSSREQIENLQQQTEQQDSESARHNKQIDIARVAYNSLVENYNASIKRFPGSYIAEQNNMHPQVYFNIEERKKQASQENKH